MFTIAVPHRNLLIFLLLVLCVVMLGVVAFTVYFNNRRSAVNRYFFYYLCAVLAWSVPAVIYIPFEFRIAELLLVQMMAGALIGPLFYFFARALYRAGYTIRPVELLLFLPFVVILCYNGARLLDGAMLAEYRAGVAMRDLVLTRKPDAAYALYSASLILPTVAGLIITFLAYRREREPAAKRRNAWIFFTMAGTWPALLIVSNIMTLLGVRTPTVVITLVVSLSIVVIGFSIVRLRAWSVEHLLELIRKRESQLEMANEELTAINNELMAAREVARRDLSMAVNVQRNFFPSSAPSSADWDLAYFFRPMAGVSGDFYDFYLPDGTLRGVGLFDVSGHGISSALVTMIARSAIFRFFKEQGAGALGGILARANRELYADIGTSGYYLTGILLRFEGGRVEYANANHPPLMRKRGSQAGPALAEDDTTRGFFIGMFPDIPAFDSVVITCQAGDCLALYTDGVTEARDTAGSLFGETRLTTVLASAPDGDADAVLSHLVAALTQFMGSLEQLNDDVTIIIMKKR